jgi:hypothetical protein
MCNVFKRTQTVVLIIVCERCGKQMLKEKYAANRTEVVTVKSICDKCRDKCVRVAQEKDERGNP